MHCSGMPKTRASLIWIVCVALLIFDRSALAEVQVGSRGFRRPVACSIAASSSAAVNFSSSTRSLTECALRCIDSDWCAALVYGFSGCCDCALLDWQLYYGIWLGQGDYCHDRLFEKDTEVEQLHFSTCQQIDVRFDAACSRAIDGNINQVFSSNSCTHTNNHDNNWWRASLPERAFIESVALYNRQDCCPERLNNFTISLDGSVFASYFSPSVFSVKNFSCGRVGQTVQVDQYMSNNFLTLCEVVAYGRRFQ